MSKRLRLVIAPLVSILLVLQSVSPGAFALNEIIVAPDSVVVAEDNGTSTPEGEDVGESNNETSAPDTEVTGESEGDEDARDGEGDNEVVEESPSLIGPDQNEADDAVPAAAPQSVVRPMAVVGPGVTGITISTEVLENVCDDLRIDGTWAVSDDAQPGDTFTFEFDSRLNVAPGIRTLQDNNGIVVAYMQVLQNSNVATFQLTPAVVGLEQVNGTFFLVSSGCWGESSAGNTITLSFSSSAGGTWTREVTVPPAPLQGPGTDSSKSGVFTDDETITWTVSFPTGPSDGATINDPALTGWVFDIDSFNANNAGGSDLQVTGGPNGITVTSGAYTSGKPSFTIQATPVDGWEGLGLPTDNQGRTIFTNEFTGTNTGLNGEAAPIEGSATAPKPLPPPVFPPETAPVKTGTFTRDDEGRVNPNGAIQWTVYFPVGTSGGATITDTALDGWEFDLDSFTPINTWVGATPVLSEDSTTGSITVTVGPYSNEFSAPGFTILANITDQNVDRFDNIAYADNTDINETPLPRGEDADFVERGSAPGARDNISKSGAFTADETITWTVSFPTGPSAGATLEDLALDGWVFDTSTFNANNAGGSDLQLTEDSDAEGITVTSGAYTSGTPSFTIQATLVDGWEDLELDIDGQGRTLFVNTVEGTNLGLDSEEVPLGPETEVVPKPLPAGPATDIWKGGTFTADETITWTVNFPTGPSAGATLEDLALEGWVFDVDSFNANNAGGSNLQLTEDSDANSITVTSEGYTDGRPSFTIRATLVDGWADLNLPTDDQGRILFENTITGSNEGLNGETEDFEPFTVYAAKPLPPATGTNPTKKGEWANEYDQGFLNPEGAIEWTIMAPHGPASEIVITDTAGDNWEFVCDDDNPRNSISLINGWQTVDNERYDVTCSPEELTVTFTDVRGDQWNPVGFTVDATITTPFADGQGFNNTVISVTNNIDGTITRDGRVTSEWLVQDSDFGGEGGGSRFVIPMAPTVEGAVCEDGVEPEPQIILPSGVEGLTYNIVEDIDPGTGNYVVSATKDEDRTWGSPTPGWVPGENENELIYSGNVEIVPCGPISETILPVDPTVEGAVCEEGVSPDPQIVYGTGPEGVEYSTVSEVDPETGDYVVKATITGENLEWGDLSGTGWVVDEDDESVAIYEGNETIVPCDPVIPVLPEIGVAVCEGGEYTLPAVEFTGGNENITYSDIVVENGVITATATFTEDGIAWDASDDVFGEDGNWTIVSPTEATYSGTYDENLCDPVAPVLPEIGVAVCEGGEYTLPAVEFTGGNENITYSNIVVENGVITATATFTEDGIAWDASDEVFGEDGNWTIVSPTEATYSGTYDENLCDPVAPVLPEIGVAVCEGGEYTLPAVEFTGGNENITYSNIVVENGVITATATFTEDGIAWDASDDVFGEDGNWTIVSPTEATYSGTYEENLCEPIAPVLPTVDGNVCVGGVYTPPTVTFGEGTDGVAYEGTAQGGQVTATATIVEDGIAWDVENLPEGWSPTEDPAVITYVGTYVEAPCAPVVPAYPIVEEAVCVGGEVIDPVVTTIDTERITYTIEGTPVSGGTVTVTATLTDGFEWDENMPEGWTVNPENPAEATYIVELADVECTPVVPELPVVTPAVCEGGEVTTPTVALPTTPGITYTKEGAEVPGGTVTITATVEPGYGFGELPEGWTINPENPGEATYEVVLADVECEPVIPVAPVVTPAVCEEGKIVPPSVELPTTPGITYTKEGAEVPGGTVVITAELEDGYEWGEMPEGWTLVDPTTATFTVTFDTISCEVEKPAEEDPVQVTELPSTGTGTEHAGSGLILASMAGLMLAAVALRMNAFRRS